MSGNRQRYTLLDDATGNGDAYEWTGGRLMFAAISASWGGGSVKLQYLLPDGTTWVDVGSDTNLTADGVGGAELPQGKIRAVATTATVTAWVLGTTVGGN